MIISCINCDKKFNVDSSLIPENGRQIMCGSCDHSWYFKRDTSLTKTIISDIENNPKKIESDENQNDNLNNFDIKKNSPFINNEEAKIPLVSHKDIINENKIKNSKIRNFFSYILVFIISSMTLIILIDTLKSPIINFFPELELVLFNLFETLKDVKLFIIDLT